MMDLQFLGATGTVTGSKYLLRHGKSVLMIDCGLFQGYKQLRLRNWAELPVDPASIDAVVLTHAHVDHSGYLPLLARQGFRGKVYCTRPTLELSRILLIDSGHLQEEEAEYMERHRLSRHRPALPLYTEEDARRCLKQFVAVDYAKPWNPAPGLQVTLSPAGHMLGAACVRVEADCSILFSGDLGRNSDLLLHGPARPPASDYLVVESTYGDRLHEKEDPLEKLAEVINRTAGRGGKVIIPAFAVGRAQSMIYAIHLLKSRKLIHNLPIFLNSPMAAQAMRVYQQFPHEHRLSPEQTEAMCNTATIVDTPEDSRALNGRHGPMVIIAASGMATGGRVVHHLKAFAPDHRNTILFAGYQAGGTRGAKMLAGASTVRIHGEDVPVRAEVASLDNYSAHADAAELVDWMRGFPKPPRQTFVTHGEPDAADALRWRIEHELRWSCRVPDYLESVSLQ
jgi:metallo-beta-lactamase family protein